jgi:preprotein translocase subunit YajC
MGLALAIGWFLLVLAAAYWFMVRPQRQSMVEHAVLLQNLEVGDEIISAGGVYGTIRGLRDDEIDLEVADGVTIKLARGAVARLASSTVPDQHDEAV